MVLLPCGGEKCVAEFHVRSIQRANFSGSVEFVVMSWDFFEFRSYFSIHPFLLMNLSIRYHAGGRDVDTIQVKYFFISVFRRPDVRIIDPRKFSNYDQ